MSVECSSITIIIIILYYNTYYIYIYSRGTQYIGIPMLNFFFAAGGVLNTSVDNVKRNTRNHPYHAFNITYPVCLYYIACKIVLRFN